MSYEEQWTVTHLDGVVEKVSGSVRMADGVLWIESRGGVTGRIVEQKAWPLTSLRCWERG